jgi:hypothetical protein
VQIGGSLARLHETEADLADELRKVADRHAAEHDVYHVCHTLAKLCDAIGHRLEPVAERYGRDLPDEEPGGAWTRILATMRGSTGAIAARSSKSGLILLRDLRELYLAAQECLIDWTMVSQAAKAARDQELISLAEDGQSETGRIIEWAKTRIKVAAPQALVVG